ncbi:circularly permuted type 2 ATP-grasp protein [Bosea sp. LjRoot90]|uniref:circularly permuted type 2 ATP-grasp protein n=1 Tax=Bosea sp. LjRoot90 TaxID=3342342 RepID=UPI003ED06783
MVAFDEMTGGEGGLRSAYAELDRWLKEAPPEMLALRRSQAELFFRRIGITFAVYGDEESTERLIPFDIIPRVLTKPEWTKLEAGLRQRVTALNMFLADVYGPKECLKAGIIPADLVYRNACYQMQMVDFQVPHGIYCHIAGIDIVRVDADTFYVLEDNARTPSGVSYMMENREVMLRLFPELFATHRVAPVDNYPDQLLATLRSVAPRTASSDPTICLLTPGQYNSAFYEHSFLADKLGVELVEGSDLLVKDDVVYMRTTQGPKRVDVIYRRIDDDFIDPLVFRSDSVLGVPGIIGAYKAGNVTLANAVGTGVSDDKAVYSYMPEIVKFFTGEEPILKNVPTYRCREREANAYVLDNLDKLVVKEVNGSGGYGMLVGPHASKQQIETFRKKLKAQPEGFIAQPTLALSTCPTFVASGVAPRHVDLRPYVLSGANGISCVPGGLTRVALKEGSLVVNSSQGGGTKDTWVLDA